MAQSEPEKGGGEGFMRYRWLLAGSAMALAILALPAKADNHALTSDAPAAEAPAAEADETARQHAALAEAVSLGALWIETQRRYARIPAISVAVARGDNTVWSRGFGTIDRKGRVPASGDTLYSICSISKLFTAVAIGDVTSVGLCIMAMPCASFCIFSGVLKSDKTCCAS